MFWPFVEAIKTHGVNVDKRIYIKTLLSLAMAHPNSENFETAYVYVKDAYSFYRKLGLELTQLDFTGMLLTLMVCSYFDGDIDTAFETANKVERLITSGSEESLYLSLRFSPTSSGRAIFKTLYARLLVISAVTSAVDDNYLTKAIEVLSSSRHSSLSILEKVNTMMLMSDIEGVNVNLMSLSSIIKIFQNSRQFSPVPGFLNTYQDHNVDTEDVVYDRQKYLYETSDESESQTLDETDSYLQDEKNDVAEKLKTSSQDEVNCGMEDGTEDHFPRCQKEHLIKTYNKNHNPMSQSRRYDIDNALVEEYIPERKK